MYRTSDGGMVGGITMQTGEKSSTIYIPPSAKSLNMDILNPYKSNVNIVHELIHAYAYSKGFSYSENAAYTYNVAYYKAYNMYNHANAYRYKNMENYDRQQSWRRLPSFINTGLKR